MRKSLLLISVLLASSVFGYFPLVPVARGSRPIDKTIDHDYPNAKRNQVLKTIFKLRWPRLPHNPVPKEKK
jgi:hypothetical protein